MREGEIDLIAARGEVLAFCEVKTLVAAADHTRGPANPVESVGYHKRVQVRRMARAWLAARADAAAWRGRPAPRRHRRVLSPAGELLRLEHIEERSDDPRRRPCELRRMCDPHSGAAPCAADIAADMPDAASTRAPARTATCRAPQLLAAGRLHPPGDGASLRGPHGGRHRPRGPRRRRQRQDGLRGLALDRGARCAERASRSTATTYSPTSARARARRSWSRPVSRSSAQSGSRSPTI